MKLLGYPKFQGFDSNGDPLSGGLLYTYKPATTTDKTTYSDKEGTTPNANPVVLDSRGEASVYCDGDTKIVLKTSAGVTIWTVEYSGSEIDGTIYAGSDLVTAVSNAGSDNKTIILDKVIAISANLSIPANVTFVPNIGAKLQVATGVTVTFASQPQAGAYQWIELTGTGAVAFTKALWAYPE